MRNFEKTVEIAVPPDRVWAVMIDVEHWSDWTASITSIRKLDPPPFAVGSRVHIVQPKLRPGVWTVTDVEPGRSFTWTSGASGFMRVFARHDVEPTDSGCRVTLSVVFKGILGAFAAAAYGKLTAEYMGMEAAGLKRRSETRGATEPISSGQRSS